MFAKFAQKYKMGRREVEVFRNLQYIYLVWNLASKKGGGAFS